MALGCSYTADQSSGDVISRSILFFRHNWRLIVKILAWPSIWMCAASLVLQLNVSSGFTDPGDFQWLKLLPAAIALLAILIAKWILILRQLALLRFALGFDSGLKDALAHMSRYKWELLAFFAFGTALIAFLITTIVAASAFVFPIGGTPAVVWAFIASFMCIGLCVCAELAGFVVLAVLACEGGSLLQVLRRGVGLCFSNFSQVLRFGVWLLVAMLVLCYPLSLPMLILSVIDLLTHGVHAQSYQMPLYMILVGQIWETAVNMIIWTLIFVGFGQFYFGLRVEKEGLDILRKLELLQSGQL